MDAVKELIAKAHAGDKEARERLVRENLGLVQSIVRRFRGRGTEEEDLFQIGSIGLMKAIDKFDLSYDVKFSTYAVPVITGEIKRFLRDDGMIKVSRTLKETAVKASVASEGFRRETGREPTVEEISARIGVEREVLTLAMESGEQVESLQKIIFEGDGHAISVEERLPDEKDHTEELLNRVVLDQLLSGLDAQEKKLICLRYFADKTQTEVAKALGISQVQVSRLEKKILLSMREEAGTTSSSSEKRSARQDSRTAARR